MAGTKPGIEVEGGPQLRRAFKNLGGRTADLSAIHRPIADDVADTARSLVPRVSGALGGSIKGRGTATRASVEAGKGLPYEGPIHFGWHERNIEPQPFLYDALDDRRHDIVKRYNDGIGDLVERFDREAPD